MMSSSTWIMITTAILLTANFVSYSLSSKHAKDPDYEGDNVCNIQALHSSPYVQAYRTESISSLTCNGSGRSFPLKSSQRKEVHVLYIRFPSNNNQSGGKIPPRIPQIVLNIATDGEDAVRNLDVVFVLASNQGVTWKIMSDFIEKTRHLSIWVSRNSQLLPISHSNVKVRTFETISNPQLLSRWVMGKFNKISVMKELDFQRKITRSVGLGSNRGKMCRERSLEESSEPIKGCIMSTNQGLHNKDVHIIELEADSDESSVVALNIQAHSNVSLRRHLLLVLKSRRPTKWVVLTSKLRGTLDIVTDQTVDTTQIDMQSVRVVNELLSDLSGLKLVAWTVANYGRPVSYTSANVVNRIDLTVDGVDGNRRQRQDFGADGELNKVGGIVQKLLEHIRTLVRQHQSVSCLPGSLEVALLKSPLMAYYTLSNEQLSLIDPTCLAQQNDSHFFWKTNPESCGGIVRHHENSVTVGNAILVQPVRSSVDDPVEGFSGSGMENYDESDDNYDDTFSDDEDIVRRSLTIVRVNFGCTYFLETQPPDEGIDYYLKIYKDSSFQHEILSFPMFVGERQNLFVAAGLSSAIDGLQPVILKCGLIPVNSSESLEIPLIINGCAVDQMTSRKDGGATLEERFEFQIRDEWRSHVKIHLLCYVTVCSRLNSRFTGVTECTPEAPRCSSSGVSPLASSLQSNTTTAKALRTGPFILRPVANTALAERSSQVKSGSLDHMDREIQQTITHDDRTNCDQVVRVEGLDSPTVIAIAFAAFIIGALLSGSLWYIHTRTGPAKKRALRKRSPETSGESTPCSTAPIAVCQTIDQV